MGLCLVKVMKIDKAIKSKDSIEFIVEDNRYRIHGILNKGHYFNWIAFPEFNVCCELASFDDVFWNEEALSLIFKSPNQITSVLNVIEHLKSMFNDDSTYFDGHHFVSTREYIFWLETECESLSRQLLEFELHLENNDVDKWLEYARLNYYKYMREQYGKDAFLDIHSHTGVKQSHMYRSCTFIKSTISICF